MTEGIIMKKTLATLLIPILIFSCVALFSSCDKQITDDSTAENTASAESVTEKESTAEELSDESVTADEWYDEVHIGEGTVHTTNKDYQKDYDELTLPSDGEADGQGNGSEKITETVTDKDGKPVTDKNGEKVTAEVPQLTVNGTTASASKVTSTKTPEKTTKESTTGNSQQDGTANNTNGENEGTGSVTPSQVPRPNVTYFDKYVKSVLNSGNYTATVVGNFRGYGATVNIYKNGGTAYSISTTYKSVPVSCRYFYSGGNVYIIVPSMQSYAVVDVADPVVGVLESTVASESVAMTADGMAYCGLTSGTGYVCESYKDTDGTVYKYYFNSGGLTKIGVSGPSGNSTINVSLKSGVSSGGVFSVPSGYKKVDVQVFIDKVESL